MKALLCLWLLMLALQLHGFSMSSWNRILPSASWGDPLVGKARDVRSDDWMAQLPAMLSQTQHDPRFPELNHLIHPEGHEMSLGMNVPLRAWVALFKPTTWGYFVSPDFGLSWHWQLRVFLLLVSSYAFFLGVFASTRLIAIWGALCLTASSFFAYWSYISEPITSLGLLASLLVFRQLRVPTPRAWEAPLLFWTLVAFCLNQLYPPFQVPMIYFALAIGIYAIGQGSWSRRGLLVVSATTLLALVTVALHFYQNLPILHKILQTEYPGLRVSTGGDLSVGHWLMMSFLALSGYSSLPGIHISETGSSFFVGFAALGVFLVKSKRLPPSVRRQASLLALLTVGLGLYSFVGIPKLIAQASGWARVPGARTLGLWSLLNICWLVWWASHSEERMRMRGLLVFTGALLALLLGAAAFATKQFEVLAWPKMLSGIGLMLLCGALMEKRRVWGMGLTLVVIAAASLWFNPIERGSHARLLASEEVRTLKREFEASGKRAILLLDKDFRTANFPRMVGVPSYGGMHFVPQLDFWKTLDPEALHSKTYNRFAHVVFGRAAPGHATSFENPQNDVLEVLLSESDLARLAEEAWVIERLF